MNYIVTNYIEQIKSVSDATNVSQRASMFLPVELAVITKLVFDKACIQLPDDRQYGKILLYDKNHWLVPMTKRLTCSFELPDRTKKEVWTKEKFELLTNVVYYQALVELYRIIVDNDVNVFIFDLVVEPDPDKDNTIRIEIRFYKRPLNDNTVGSLAD